MSDSSEKFSGEIAELTVLAAGLNGYAPPRFEDEMVHDGRPNEEALTLLYSWPSGGLLPESTLLRDVDFKALLAAHRLPVEDPNRESQIREATVAVDARFPFAERAAAVRAIGKDLPALQREYAERITGSLTHIAAFGLAEAGLGQRPSFKAVYQDTYGVAPVLLGEDTSLQAQSEFLRENLNAALSAMGISEHKDLAERIARFEQDREKITSAEMQPRISQELDRWHCYLQECILPHIDLGGLGLSPEALRMTLGRDVLLSSNQPSSLIYFGDGQAQLVLKQIPQGNTFPAGNLTYLVGHEVAGHFSQAVMEEAAVKKGFLPPEVMIGLGNSSKVALAEGFAVTFPFYSPKWQRNPELRVLAARLRLVYLGQHEFAVKVFGRGEIFDEAQEARFAIRPGASAFWRETPALFEATWLTAYQHGISAVQPGVQKLGMPGVACTILDPRTPLDLYSFRQALSGKK